MECPGSLLIDKKDDKMDPKLIEHFLSAQDVRQTSKQSHGAGLKLFFNWLATQSVIEPTKSDVLAYRNSLIDAGLSTLTINSYLTSIRQFFSWLSINRGTDNVAAGVKGPRPAKGFRKDALTTDQIGQLLATFDPKKSRA
jgi:site-specific recombinase XerD